MLSLFTGNPLAFFAAVYILSQSTITINEQETGALFRGERYVRQLPPGGHYHLPWIDRVIKLNTEVGYGKALTHEAALATDQRCAFNVKYWYMIDDPDEAARTAEFTRFGRVIPISIENRLRREIETFASETRVEDIDRSFEIRLYEHLNMLRKQTFEDGTLFDSVGSSEMTCSDPVAAKAIEVAKRPIFRVGSLRPFMNLTGCGEAGPDTLTRTLPTYSIARHDNSPVDLSDLKLHYRVIGETTMDLEQKYIVQGFVRTTLFNTFINIDDDHLATTNLCSMLLEDPQLKTSLTLHGIELVALDPFTPQYAIHERIEYDDTAD